MHLITEPNKKPEDRPLYRKKRGRLILTPQEYKKLLVQVFTRDGWKCRVPDCRRRNDLHGHHIVFRSHGGDDAAWNVVTLCRRCHDAIHNRWLIIEAIDCGKELDANGELVFKFVNGWEPSKKVTT